MAGGRREEEGGCRVRFRIEWAMWGNLNALYAAASELTHNLIVEDLLQISTS